MENSIITSSLMGPILLLLGIGLFINTEFYKHISEGFKKNKGLIIVSSIGGMILGSYMIANHNILLGIDELIISIVGWIILLKSSFMIALPTTFSKIMKNIIYTTNLLKTIGIICISIGLYLINYAYFGI